jgi:hypothetical protein
LIACDKIKRQMNKDAQIIDEKVTYAYGEDFVIVNVVIETLEEIGETQTIPYEVGKMASPEGEAVNGVD